MQYHFVGLDKQDASANSGYSMHSSVERTASNDNPQNEIVNAQIIGVPQLDTYKSCIRCKARVEPMTPPLGRCSKENCLLSQRYDFCPEQLTAKIIFTHGDHKHHTIQTLHPFSKTICELAQEENDVTIDMLLKAPPISTIFYNEKNGYHWNN